MHLELKEIQMKSRKFPSSDEIKQVLNELEKVEGTKLLSKNASNVDKIKFELCKNFIIYKQEKKLSQVELAEKINIDQALMSKILHYRFEEFTIDRLVKYLEALHKDVSVKIA